MSDLSPGPTRRTFLARSGAAIGGGLLALQLPTIMALAKEAHAAHLNGEAFKTLTDEEAKEIEAFAAQIVPTDETPGATEAGAIYFIDRALGDERSGLLNSMREGMADLQERVQRLHGADAKFSDLSSTDQITLMTEIEDTEFFASLAFLTWAGMLSHPSYGGNRDRIGWKLIGFDDRAFWQPPFGSYDAGY